MKIIISHDVDHLYGEEHWCRDLFYQKLWVRSLLELIRGKITFREFFLRITLPFRKNINNIDALMKFDKEHGVDSTFFFGMNQGLGMSYKPHEAKEMICKVKDNGFSVGVHGIEYEDYKKINDEYLTFKNDIGFIPCGNRMHYVRYSENTFEYLSKCGYCFDSTEFDKQQKFTLKDPYFVGKMIEFPLTIMDAYLSQTFEKAKEETIHILNLCKENNMKYVTVLFHDNQFCDAYNDMFKWYKWLIKYVDCSSDYEFSSYEDAIEEIRGENI